MIIEHFKPFEGQHCETTATGSLLNQLGIHLSEPMLFGLGEGLGFIFWNMKNMDFPFIGGRVKPDILTENICRNLNLKLDVLETSSKKKAWQNVVNFITEQKVVGLKLDCYHLEYFSNKIHFAGHYVAMFGYDNNYAYLVDTKQQGGMVKTSLESLALARNEKGPMSSKNKVYAISNCNHDVQFDLKDTIVNAITRNAKDYLNPPIKNIGYQGILKTSKEIKTWFHNSKNLKHEFQTTAMLMENAGTGGALFRNLYRDFLSESYEVTENSAIKLAHNQFIDIAEKWTELSHLFHQVGETSDFNLIETASKLLVDLSEQEENAMKQLLLNIC